MSDVKRPANPDARVRRLSDDEIDRLLLATGYHAGRLDTAMSRVGAAMLFAIETAMRAGEICGLNWPDVDKVRRVAHLAKTKNGHARDVPLSRRALEIIEQLPQGENTIFNLPSASLDALFRKAKARALIPDLHFHDCRHEAASQLAESGWTIPEIAAVTGHKNWKHLQRYVQIDPASLHDKKR